MRKFYDPMWGKPCSAGKQLFRVRVSYTISSTDTATWWQKAFFEIEADDEEEAKELAVEQVHDEVDADDLDIDDVRIMPAKPAPDTKGPLL